MFVCVCQAITERQVREAVTGGARTVRDLRERLGLASGCGVCVSCAFGIINERAGTSAPEERPACAA